MKKTLLILSIGICSLSAYAQSAIDGYNLLQQDMKGTARFMSMGGAFGALGGDMTTLSYNPAGIGVYRSSDIGMTVDFDIQNSSMDFGYGSMKDNQFKFLLNNGGYVGAARIDNSVLKNFNWGFTYNRAASFNRRYSGAASSIDNSMTNYIAGVTNDAKVVESELVSNNYQSAYYDGNAPWISILGYDSYFISPSSNMPNSPNWVGQWGNGTSGSSFVNVIEQGGIDEYNISFGGNFANLVYWGMDFGINHLNFRRQSLYGENLANAYVTVDNGEQVTGSQWDLYNDYAVSGTGFNYKLGVIVRPIQELRLGFAFHTPTWYGLTENYYANTQFNYPQYQYSNPNHIPTGAETNNGSYGFNDVNFRTPWRFIASAAGVIGNDFIVSADVDWTGIQHMHFSSPYYSGIWGGSDLNDPFYYTNKDAKDYYKTSLSFRVGAEFRVTPQLSLRAGYAHVTSPVKEDAKKNQMTIYTSGTYPSYEFDTATDYVTCGIGYRYKAFYIDAAYVYKHRGSEWHAFTCDPLDVKASGAVAKVSSENNQIVVTAGFRF